MLNRWRKNRDRKAVERVLSSINCGEATNGLEIVLCWDTDQPVITELRRFISGRTSPLVTMGDVTTYRDERVIPDWAVKNHPLITVNPYPVTR
jgi:hypothetical protein